MNIKNSKKILKYNKIVKESLEGYHKGFQHRDHRTHKNKSGKKKFNNFKKDIIDEELENEWKKLKQEINIIGR